MPTSDPELTGRIKEANLIARQHFGVFQWPTLLLITVLVAVQVALVGAGLTGQLPLALAVALVALLQYPSYICYHEAAHGNIAGGRTTAVNETAGSLLGLLLGVPPIAHPPQGAPRPPRLHQSRRRRPRPDRLRTRPLRRRELGPPARPAIPVLRVPVVGGGDLRRTGPVHTRDGGRPRPASRTDRSVRLVTV